MLPNVAVAGGGPLPPGAANVQYTFKLNKGEQAQFTQMEDLLTGGVVGSTSPVGLHGRPALHARALRRRLLRPRRADGPAHQGARERVRGLGVPFAHKKDPGGWRKVLDELTRLKTSSAAGGSEWPHP